MTSIKQTESGFTLIEVLVTMVVFTISALAALSMMLTIIRSNQQAAYMTDALAAGRSEMERIMAGNVTGQCNSPCASAAACTSECFRGVRAGGRLNPGPCFQVDNLRTPAGGAVFVQVNVRWPRRIDEAAIGYNANGTIDCTVGIDCVARPGDCSVITLHNQMAL